MSERPTDEQVERVAVTGSVSHAGARTLAREVQASRRLIAELRANLEGARDPYCGDAIDEALRLIDGAGL